MSEWKESVEERKSRHVYEQLLMLWQDQVAFADALRDKRKIYSSGLVIVAGLGIFKFSWYREPNVAVAFEGASLRWMQGLFVLILLAFGFAAYFMFTERSWLRARIAREDPTMQNVLPQFGWLPEEPRTEKPIGDRAISELWLSPEDGNDLAALEPHEIWNVRSDHLRLAYLRLVASNRRVNQRIEAAVVSMGAAFLLTGVAAGLYILAVG